jgi:hypothetical protein
LARLGLSRCGRYGSLTPLGPNEYRARGLALRLGMPRVTIQRLVKSGCVNAQRDKEGL